MPVRFSDEWTFRGLQALVLENEMLRVTILPELGGKIWSIVAKARDREMLWHNPRVPPRPASYGATYDNWFCGGWDEVFPNDFPVEVDSEAYPDHGEVWALPAEWQVVRRTEDAVSISFRHRGVAVPTVFTKTVTLRKSESSLRIAYEIENTGAKPLDVHWKSHPALPVTAGARLHVPADRVLIDEDFGDGVALGEALPDPDSGGAFFQYRTQLRAGRCAVTYPAEEIGFGLTFDPEIVTSVWVFATFSGWRDLRTIIIEPCTGHFANLERAIAERAVLRLESKSTVSTELVASVLVGPDAMDAFVTEGAG